jgi:hypothetical protein
LDLRASEIAWGLRVSSDFERKMNSKMVNIWQ